MTKGDAKPDAPLLHRPTRFAVLYANGFEVAIAIAAIVSAIVYFANPNDPAAAVARQLGSYSWVWNALYLAGGFGVVVGLALSGTVVRWRGRVIGGDGRIELSGLLLLTTAIIVNAVSILSVTGFQTPSAATFVALVFACLLRIRTILSLRKALYPVSVPGK